jgi:hypothetical protein
MRSLQMNSRQKASIHLFRVAEVPPHIRQLSHLPLQHALLSPLSLLDMHVLASHSW